MAAHPRIAAQEAYALLAQGYLYLDVRTEAEFSTGHPAGAYNIPFQENTEHGLRDNPDFLRVVSASFEPEQKVIVGCQSGERSLHAAVKLLEAGYTHVVEQRAGYGGSRDPFGRVLDRGWRAQGLPCATEPMTGHDYRSLKKRA
jgi:rhodanese-related sulfurtransferase